MTENVVVEAVASFLRTEGWTIVGICTTAQQGYDVEAVRGRERLVVEAKGATSSKPGTGRYGLPFNPGQHKSHIGVAIVKAMEARAAGLRSAVAFPDVPSLRRVLDPIAGPLAAAGIETLLVAPDGSVTRREAR